jgi:hypothetical protein
MIDVIEGCIRADLKEKQDAQELRERMLMLAIQTYSEAGYGINEDRIIGLAERFRRYVREGKDGN